MRGRLLVLVAMLGLVLAPVLPTQRLYLCLMDGQVHSSCCCHAAAATDAAAGASGCCKTITIHSFLAPGHDPVALVPADQTALLALLPAAPLVRILVWREPTQISRHLAPPPPPPAWFVRTAALLI